MINNNFFGEKGRKKISCSSNFHFFGGWRPPTHPAFPAFQTLPHPPSRSPLPFKNGPYPVSNGALRRRRCRHRRLDFGPFQTLRFAVTFQTVPIPSLTSPCNPNFGPILDPPKFQFFAFQFFLFFGGWWPVPSF